MIARRKLHQICTGHVLRKKKRVDENEEEKTKQISTWKMNLEFWNYLYFLGLSLVCSQNVQEIDCFVFWCANCKIKAIKCIVLIWPAANIPCGFISFAFRRCQPRKKNENKNSRLFCKEKCYGKTSSNHQYPSMICSFQIVLLLCYVDWMVCQSHKSVKWWFCNNLYYIFNFNKKKSKANFFFGQFFHVPATLNRLLSANAYYITIFH